jgi:hypothetical protein
MRSNRDRARNRSSAGHRVDADKFILTRTDGRNKCKLPAWEPALPAKVHANRKCLLPGECDVDAMDGTTSTQRLAALVLAPEFATARWVGAAITIVPNIPARTLLPEAA